LPLQALDYGAGDLLAFGAMAALLHQRQRGGSWQASAACAACRTRAGSTASD
jgi:hypothetical protein